MQDFRKQLLRNARIRSCDWLRAELTRLELPTALVVVGCSVRRGTTSDSSPKINACGKSALVVMDFRSNMEDLVARAERLVSEEGAVGVVSATTRNLFFAGDRELFEQSPIKALYVTHPPMGELFARMTVLEESSDQK